MLWLFIILLSVSTLLVVWKLVFLRAASQCLLFLSVFNTHVVLILLLSSVLLDKLAWLDLVIAYWLVGFLLNFFWLYLLRFR